MSAACPACGFSEFTVGPFGNAGDMWLVNGACAACGHLPMFEPAQLPVPTFVHTAPSITEIEATVRKATEDAVRKALDPSAMLARFAELPKDVRDKLHVLLDFLEEQGVNGGEP